MHVPWGVNDRAVGAKPLTPSRVRGRTQHLHRIGRIQFAGVIRVIFSFHLSLGAVCGVVPGGVSARAVQVTSSYPLVVYFGPLLLISPA